ncbi:Zn(2)-C6 fungal-type domain-containing protein [Madurella fahalii]|uniref:Zn(2)-C6 fungal-type domain-containing protein n=1 Tax=Madurella fahalii TaxID=1157608 RepID=A0ABQ0G406_9PEZI
MAGMARHGSASAYQGFSVCQPALGSALQWLPAIGTPELDDMINAFIPGPSSIQDKRTHIAMDFFEYSRQTGETFKFYPVPSAASFTPVTASPASSTLYDSGYGSSFNLSPVMSDQGSWTRSPAALTPSMSTDAGARSRSSASKKASTSSSRQATVDFSNHPGMRIMTKDGRDVTNSASRGCKTKEQRDHAHLMRIIKACDSCRRKKIRCDPSHKKRTASQASASQTEQKPAKKPRKAEEPPPAAVGEAVADFSDASFDPTTLDLVPFDASFQDIEEYWNQFITFDQEPAAVAAQHGAGDFDFDSFIDFQSFSSPSSLSSSTSPSQAFTPYTPAAPGASPTVTSDVVVDVAGGVSLDDPTVPYLNPDVLHGTNYVDFNLFSPGPDAFDEDPVLQMRDVASLPRSPRSRSVATVDTAANDPRHTYDPPTTSELWRISGPESSVHVIGATSAGRSSPTRRPLFRSAALHTSTSSHTSSIASANVVESPVSPGSSPRPRRPSQIHSVADNVASRAGMLDSPSRPESQPATHRTPPQAAHQRYCLGRDVAVRRGGYSCGRGSLSRLLQTGVESRSCSVADGQRVVQRSTVVLNAAVNAELTTMVISTSPTRRTPAGEDVKNGPTSRSFSPTFFQLAVFGLVSLLCASALQSHLACRVNLVNILSTILSLTPLALRRSGASSATGVASTSLLIPTPSGIVDNVKSKIQAVDSNLASTVSRRARNVTPRLLSVGSFLV